MDVNIPTIGIPVTARPRRPEQRSEPRSEHVGDVLVPWNVGNTIFRLKAARDMVVNDVTFDCKEVVSPTGKPVMIEAWRNGIYAGDVALSHGVTSFGNKGLSLSRFDEIELRIVVRGEHLDVTEVKGLWLLYCVQ